MADSKTFFLPKYSKLYFEQKKNSAAGYQMIILYSVIIAVPILVAFGIPMLLTFEKDEAGEVAFGVILLLAYIAFIVYHLVIRKKLLKVQKDYGMRFCADGVKRIGLHGEEETIPYSFYEEAVRAGRYCYEKTGLVIGKGSNKLTFHYEIGNAAAQQEVKDCYQKLQENIKESLPPFETKCLGLLDKRYFYNRSLKTQTISLLCAMILLLGVCSNLTERMIIGIMILCPWECISLYILVKDAVMIAKNNAALQEEFKEYEHVRLGSRYDGYLYAAVVMVVLIWLNTVIIF